MAVMHSSPFDLAPQALATSRSAAHTLRRLGQAGLFRLSLPSEHGGLDAPVGDLAVALAQLRAAHPAAARLALAQLGAIQALLLGDNVALREFRLPALVAGERAAVLAGGLDSPVLEGLPSAPVWRISGLLPGLANLSGDGFSLIARARLGDTLGWVCLDSETDGLDVLPPHPPGDAALARQAGLGDVRCRRVLFRVDEWLGEDSLTPALQAFQAQIAASASTTCSSPV